MQLAPAYPGARLAISSAEVLAYGRGSCDAEDRFDWPISDDLRSAHFLTTSCERRRLLDLDGPRRILLHVLSDQLERQAGGCVGFVVMPEHVRAIAWLAPSGRGSDDPVSPSRAGIGITPRMTSEASAE